MDGWAQQGRWCSSDSPSSSSTSSSSSSSSKPSSLDLNDSVLRSEIMRFVNMRPNPLSLQQVLDMLEPWRSARFIVSEMPIRYAERIRMIEQLPGWEQKQDLVDVHRSHVETFRDIRFIEFYPKRSPYSSGRWSDDGKHFTDIVKAAAIRNQDVVPKVAKAMHELGGGDGGESTISSAEADAWLDDFLLSWIGCEMLFSQYLACTQGIPTGIVDPACDVAGVCREAAVSIQELCLHLFDRVPLISIESHSAAGDERGAPTFSYIPSFLRYVLNEILKNSCRATLDACETDFDIQTRPIKVVVCADERQVAIRISDRAKGIPFEVVSRVFSYLFSTARKAAKAKEEHGEAPPPSALAGYGVGLPLSRLYARYFGGSLGLVSWPGYGTDVHLLLPRLSTEQVEVVPDQDL